MLCTNHSASHCRRKELILFFDAEILQPVLLKRSCEVLCLLCYDVLTRVEVLRYEAERGRLGSQVIGLDRKFDVEDFSICT